MVYVTVRCPSVSATPTAQADAATCGGFAAVGPTGGQEIDRLLHVRSAPSSNGAAAARRTAARSSEANASSVTFTAAVDAS